MSHYNGLGYSGKIKVSLLKNKTVLETKEYKNNGSYLLFEFLGNCLQGDYITAKNKRPQYIQGFYYCKKTGESIDPLNDAIPTALQNPQAEDSTDYKTNSVTGKIRINEAVKIKTTKGYRVDTTGPNNGIAKDKVEIYYHFRIPASQLFGNKINMFCLYANEDDLAEDYCACYLLVNDNQSEWVPIKIDNIADNYNLIIEWTMTVQNVVIS